MITMKNLKKLNHIINFKKTITMKKSNLFILLFLFIPSFGFAQSQSITLDLNQPVVPTSFTLNADSIWTETFNDVDFPYIEFNSSTFKFTHLGAGEGESWGGFYWDGFTYSKNGDNTDHGAPGNSGDWISNQWGNMAGGGIKTDAAGNVLKDENDVVLTDLNVPYLLAHWGFGGYTVPPLSVFFDDVYQAEGVYVNMSPWPYFGNIHGNDFTRPLDQDGDYFKLFIHGLDENHEDNGLKVEHYFAKFENGALTQSPNWEWIDLSALGEVYGIYFSMESTDSEDWGMNTAAYFCIDKLQIRVPEEIISVDTYERHTYKVYPTVTTGPIHIVSSEIITDPVQIIDISGRILQTVRLQSIESTVDISSYQSGLYMIKTGNKVIKIIKQ